MPFPFFLWFSPTLQSSAQVILPLPGSGFFIECPPRTLSLQSMLCAHNSTFTGVIICLPAGSLCEVSPPLSFSAPLPTVMATELGTRVQRSNSGVICSMKGLSQEGTFPAAPRVMLWEGKLFSHTVLEKAGHQHQREVRLEKGDI